jgi:hypothetical protein
MTLARTIAVTTDDPKTVTLSCVMSFLPFGRNHRPIANLDNQVAHGESSLFSHSHEVAMRPFRFVVVHHVRDLCQEQSFGF